MVSVAAGRTIGIVLVILGVLVILTPWVIFPVCEVQGSYVETVSGAKLPMTCGWTARAEVIPGILLLLAGGLLLFRNTAETRLIVGIFTTVTGVLVILLPTVLIGMCRIATHPCRLTTLPGLEILGVIIVVAGGYLVWKHV